MYRTIVLPDQGRTRCQARSTDFRAPVQADSGLWRVPVPPAFGAGQLAGGDVGDIALELFPAGADQGIEPAFPDRAVAVGRKAVQDSALLVGKRGAVVVEKELPVAAPGEVADQRLLRPSQDRPVRPREFTVLAIGIRIDRSEEHTSELQ